MSKLYIVEKTSWSQHIQYYAVTHPTDESEGLSVPQRSRGTGNRASADGDETLVLQRGRAQRTGQRLIGTNPTYQAVPSPKGDVPCIRRWVPMHYSTPVPIPTTDQSGCPLAYSSVDAENLRHAETMVRFNTEGVRFLGSSEVGISRDGSIQARPSNPDEVHQAEVDLAYG